MGALLGGLRGRRGGCYGCEAPSSLDSSARDSCAGGTGRLRQGNDLTPLGPTEGMRSEHGCLGSPSEHCHHPHHRERSVASDNQGAEYRIEHDSMGEVRVPAWAKWRAQTQRAVENFPISGTPIERELIGALAAIKGAAAAVNAELGVLGTDVAGAIQQAAATVASGDWDEHFPIDVFQTGSGTSSNMNTNEVIATLATETLGSPVHPNDHVNASQSSNDVFPSAIHVATTG